MSINNIKSVSIIVSTYNGLEGFNKFLDTQKNVVENSLCSYDCEVVCVKDGSKDHNFWQNLKNPRFELSDSNWMKHILQTSICKRFLYNITMSLILVAFSANTITSQIIGGTATEKAYDMCKGTDNNLYLAGFSSSYGSGNRDFFIARYNTETGNLSYNTWGDCIYNEIRNIIPYGQDIIATGFSFCRNGQSLQSMVTKINPQLEFEWVKNYGNWHYQHGYKIIKLDDGSLLTGGIDESIGLYGPFLVLTDNNGNLIWEKTLNDYQPSHVVDMIQKQNGNVLLICSKGGFFNLGTNWHSNSSSDANTLIIEIDLAGNIVSDTVFLAAHHDIPVKAIKTSNDGFYLLSHTQSYDGNGSFDICTQKFDHNLNIEWTKLYGTADFEYARDFEIDFYGNIHIIGTSAGFADHPVMYYLKTDAWGELIESQSVIQDFKCYGAGIELVDNNIYLLGTIYSDYSDNFVLLKNFEINEKTVFFDAAFIYPNPVSSKCSVRINNPKFFSGTTKIDILNNKGGIKESYDINLSNQNTSLEFDFSDYSSGIYFLRLINENSILTVKINVIK